MIYTFGYQGRSAGILPALLDEYRAFLADIRLQPYSANRQWSQPELRHLLGPLYLHVRALGNVNYKGGPIQIANLEVGLDTVLIHAERSGLNPLLMCMCRSPRSCHRTVVADHLANLGKQVEEIHVVHKLNTPPDPQTSLF